MSITLATYSSPPSRGPASIGLGEASHMRETKQSAFDGGRRPLEVVSLGGPFTYARQPWLASVCVPLERAVQLVVALDAALRCRLSTEALDATLKESRLALRSGEGLGRGCSGDGGGSSNSSKLEAMQEAMHTLWPGVGPSAYFPPDDGHKIFLVRWVLLHLKGCGENDRSTLGAFSRQILAGSIYSSPSLLLSSTPSENGVAPQRHGEESPAVRNNVAHTPMTPSWGAAGSSGTGGQDSYFIFRALGAGMSTVSFGWAHGADRHPPAAISLENEEDDAETSDRSLIGAGSITVGIFGTSQERQRMSSPGADKLSPPLPDTPADTRFGASLSRRQNRSDSTFRIVHNLRVVTRFATTRKPTTRKPPKVVPTGREERGRRKDRGLLREAPEDTQVTASSSECPSAAVCGLAVTCADHPRTELHGPSGLRLDTLWRRTPAPPSTGPRRTTAATATITTTATAATTTTTATTTTGSTPASPPALRSNQRTTQTFDRQMGAQEDGAPQQPQERGETPPHRLQRSRPIRLCTLPDNPGSHAARSVSSAAPPSPSSESEEDARACTKHAEELAAACVASQSSSRRGRCRSPSSPRGRPTSPNCQRRGSRSPSPRRARSGSSSPSSRGRSAVCSPLAVIKCSFPKALTEDDFDSATETVTPPLTPLQETPPKTCAPLGVSPTSRGRPVCAEDADVSTHARRSGPHGFFVEDDDEPTKATTTTMATTAMTMTEADSDVASAPLRPPPHEKRWSCRGKTGFSSLFSGDAQGGSDGSGGVNTSLNKEPSTKEGATLEAFPTAIEQNPEQSTVVTAATAAAIIPTAATAAAAADTAIATIEAAMAAPISTTTAAAAAATTASTAATATVVGGHGARHVSWSPLVMAREEAAALIRPFVARFWECEELKCRVAYDQAAARLFVKRREERGRRLPAMNRPVARRGAFFVMLSGLERSNLRGYNMWSDLKPFRAFVPLGLTGRLVPKAWSGSGDGDGGGDRVRGGNIDGKHDPISACSLPVRWTMGDFVRKMATDLLNRGQARA